MSQPLALVQARLGSTRLPRKIDARIGTRRMLDVVTARVQQTGVKWMVVAAEAYPQIAEDDVLGRFHTALTKIDAQGDHYDPIIRITADCPMLDPGLVRRVLATYRAGYFHLVGTTPAWDGLDVEVIRRPVLDLASSRATDPRDRQHVTSWIKDQGGSTYRAIELDGPALRWSVDEPEHLEFVRAVFARCEFCAAGQPHRMRESAAGLRPIWDTHDVYGLHPDGAPEPLCCEAFDLLEAHTGGPVYVSR